MVRGALWGLCRALDASDEDNEESSCNSISVVKTQTDGVTHSPDIMDGLVLLLKP